MAEVPTGVAAEVVMVRADVAAEAPGVTVFGTKTQVAPVGRVTESQVSTTALLKPFTAATVTVYAAGLPAITVRLAGAALKVKSGTGAGAALKAAAWMTHAPVVSGTVASQLPAACVI